MTFRRTATVATVAAFVVAGGTAAGAQPTIPPIFGSSGLDPGSSGPADTEQPSSCPRAIDPATFDPADLDEMTSRLAAFWLRTPGSDTHDSAIDWF